MPYSNFARPCGQRKWKSRLQNYNTDITGSYTVIIMLREDAG